MDYDQINQLYLDYLGRPASQQELEFYAQRFGSDVNRNEALKFIAGGVKSGEITQERANELSAPLGINYEAANFMAGQLADQYAKQRELGYRYEKEGDLPNIFYAQAAKLSANGLTSIYDVGEKDGVLINKVTGEPIEKIGLKGNWKEDPTSINIGPDIQLEDRGKFKRWGFDTSVEGMAHYGIDFQDGIPVFTPYYKDTSTKILGMKLEDALKTAATIAAIYYGGQYLLAEGGAAAGAGSAGAGAGTGTTLATSTAVPGSFQAALPSLGVQTAATTAASTAVPGSFQAALPGLLSSTAAGAPIYFAEAVPAEQVAYPAREVAANYTPVPGSFQEALPGLGVETAASAAPFTAAPGSFQAALPSLLSNTAATTGVLDTLRTANAVRSLLAPQTIQQQAGLGGGGGQARGVDYSGLLPTNVVGLLPLAERYRRSLI
jgi:hypothetical protein